MKRVAVLLLIVCMLAGCEKGSKELERGLVLRDKLLSSGCCIDVDITADYGDKVHTFSMECQADDKGDMTFSVTAPESIAGITGSITEEGGKLTFDDVALQFDLMADDQISPVSAPWILLKTLRSGYLISAAVEEEFLRLTIDDSYDEDALTLDIWLNDADIPVRAEILFDGRRIETLSVTNFEIL